MYNQSELENADQSAFGFCQKDGETEGCYSHGLTKRELIAAHALQGILVNAERNGFSFNEPEAMCEKAAELADQLLIACKQQEAHTQEDES